MKIEVELKEDVQQSRLKKGDRGYFCDYVQPVTHINHMNYEPVVVDGVMDFRHIHYAAVVVNGIVDYCPVNSLKVIQNSKFEIKI